MAGLAVYANSFSGSFIFDDLPTIVENPSIRRLWPLGDVLSPPSDGGTLTSRPILNLSLAINYRLGGLDVWGYHATNLAIHLINGLLLLGILWRTFQLPSLQARFGEAAWGLSLAIALLWTVHPLQTESVTYIIQRAESLAGLFYLLLLYCVIRGSQSARHVFWYLAAVVACLVGVSAKETVITAPLVVLLYDRTFLVESFGKALRRRWGLYLGLFASWGLQVYMQGKTGLPVLKEELGSMGVWAYARSQPGVILHYLRLSIWPHPLCLDYQWPVAHAPGDILPGTLAIGGLGLATVWGLAKRRSWGFLGAWFFLILAPTSSIMPLPHLAFEHRMYLSLAAALTVVVLGGYAIGKRLTRWGGLSRTAALASGTGAVLLAAMALGWLTFHRNQAYRTELSIWQETLAQRPHQSQAYQKVGVSLARLGRLDEAINYYQQAIHLNPNDAAAYNNLGNAMADAGRLPDAIEYYSQAIKSKPRYPEAHNNLGLALARSGRLAEAIEHYEQALKLNPDSAAAHNNLGSALTRTGRLTEAIAQYEEAIRILPDYAESHNNLANALHAAGRLPEAILQYEEAFRIKPDYAEAHSNQGNALLALGRLPEAIRQYELALHLKADFPEAQYNLTLALAQAGKIGEAIRHGAEAVRLAPNQPQYMPFVAWLMATHEPADGGDPKRAVELAERACTLTGRRDVISLDTLAAAYASAGRFDEATATAQEAWQSAQSADQSDLAEEIHMRLQLYRDRKPYRLPTVVQRGRGAR